MRPCTPRRPSFPFSSSIRLLLSTFAASEKRLAFLFGGLRALDADLRARGSRLIVRRGDPATELARLVSETGATAVFAEEDVWPYARRRDAAVAATAPLRLTAGLTVHPPDVVRKADGGIYTVFTPYSRAWKALPPPRRSDLLPAPQRLAPPPRRPDLASLPIPDAPALPPSVPFPPGRARSHPPPRLPSSFVLRPRSIATPTTATAWISTARRVCRPTCASA